MRLAVCRGDQDVASVNWRTLLFHGGIHAVSKFHSRGWPATERSAHMKPLLAKTLTLITILSGAALAQTPDFIPDAAYATGGSSAYAAVGDFNGDGLPDLVTYESATQSLSILFGKPDGSLAAPVSRGLGFAVTSLAAADFNRDGKSDLALATGAAVAVLVNTG